MQFQSEFRHSSGVRRKARNYLGTTQFTERERSGRRRRWCRGTGHDEVAERLEKRVGVVVRQVRVRIERVLRARAPEWCCPRAPRRRRSGRRCRRCPMLANATSKRFPEPFPRARSRRPAPSPDCGRRVPFPSPCTVVSPLAITHTGPCRPAASARARASSAGPAVAGLADDRLLDRPRRRSRARARPRARRPSRCIRPPITRATERSNRASPGFGVSSSVPRQARAQIGRGGRRQPLCAGRGARCSPRRRQTSRDPARLVPTR